MRRWLRFGIVDFLVAIVLFPPGAILAFQVTVLALGATTEPKIESAMTKHVVPIVDCDGPRQFTRREYLRFLKGLVSDSETKLAAGEFDVIEHPDIEEYLARWRSQIAAMEREFAEAGDLSRPEREDLPLAAEGSR